MNQNDTQLPPITFSPEGPYRCGDVVTATWTLRNWGDSVTNGMQLRFVTTSNISIIKERSRIPGTQPEELHKAFLQDTEEGEGILLKDLEPGDSITAIVAFKIGQVRSDEDISLQVVVDTNSGDRLRSIKSKVEVRLAPRITVPTPEIYGLKSDNQNFAVRLTVNNNGGLAEKNVEIQIPIPNVVEVGEPMLPAGASVDFNQEDRIMRIKLESVPPYQHEEIGLQFRASSLLVGDVVELTDVIITSPSSGSFYLEPIQVKLDRHVDFSNSALVIEPGPYVESGSQVLVSLHVHNHGRSAARNIPVSILLPASLIYAPGSLSINGAYDSRRDDLTEIVLPLVRAHTTTLITLNATVKSPITNQERSLIQATVDTEEIKSLEIAAESKPDFPAEENYAFVEEPQTVEPHAEREVIIKITNTGTEVSRQVRVRIDASEISINRAVVEIDNKKTTVGIIPIFRNGIPSAAIDLGEIGPQENRIVRLSITAPETFLHGTEFPLICYLRYDGNEEIVLDKLTFVGRSFPKISQENSVVKSPRMGPLRIGQPRNIAVHIQNEGSDVATRVRVKLDLPSSLKIERVSGAEKEGDTLLFHDIPPQSSSEATVTIRMTGTGTGDGTIEIHPVVSGERMNTVHLNPLILSTTSQSFIDEANIETIPMDIESALLVRMTFRNIGDGEANNVVIHSTSLEGYAINTTTLDGNIMRDIKGQSPLTYGLALPPISPGHAVEITYTVNPSDQAYTPEFIIESDDQETVYVKGKTYQAKLKHHFVPQYIGTDATKRLESNTLKALPSKLEAIDVSYRKTKITENEKNNNEEILTTRPVNTNELEQKIEVVKNQKENTEKIRLEAEKAENIRLEAEKAENLRLETERDENLRLETERAENLRLEAERAENLRLEAEKAENHELKIVEEKENTILENKVEDNKENNNNHFEIIEENIDIDETQISLSQENKEEDEKKLEEIKISSNSKFRQRDEDTDDENLENKSEEVSIVRGPSRIRISTVEKMTAPVISLKLDESKIKQIKSGIELLFTKNEIGIYRHVMAMRFFIAEKIYGTDSEVEKAWEEIQSTIKRDLSIPLMRMLMESWKPTAEWAGTLGSLEALGATEVLMREIPGIIEANVSMNAPKIEENEIISSLRLGNFGYFEKTEEASISFLDALLPEMIPTHSEKWPKLSDALTNYRNELASTFKMSAYKGIAVRHEQMIKNINEDLDMSLKTVMEIMESIESESA